MMKNTPVVLTLLCTSLIWCSVLQAMENRLVLDHKMGDDGRRKILVLTPSGLEKAKALQESYDQQQEKRNTPFAEPLNRAKYDEDLNHAREESELAEAIRLSLEEQPSETNLSHDPLETKPQVLKPSDLSLPIIKQEDDSEFKKALLEFAREEDDSQLRKALSESTQEYETHRKKIAEERRNEARKELEEVREIRHAQQQSLRSRRDELEIEQTRLLKEKNLVEGSSLIEERLKEISDMIISVNTEIETFNPLWNEIHEEILHLIKGRDPRDLPWKQGLSLSQQDGISSLSSNSLGSLTSMPSSALPNPNGGSSKDSGKGPGAEFTLL